MESPDALGREDIERGYTHHNRNGHSNISTMRITPLQQGGKGHEVQQISRNPTPQPGLAIHRQRKNAGSDLPRAVCAEKTFLSSHSESTRNRPCRQQFHRSETNAEPAERLPQSIHRCH